MLSNLFDQIFGRSKCGKREIITTTIIEPESIDINDDPHTLNDPTDTHCCFLPSFSLSDADGSGQNILKSNYEAQPQHKQSTMTTTTTTPQKFISRQNHNNDNIQQHKHRLTNYHLNHQNRIRNNQNKLNEISIFSVYLLFATLFVCICTIAVLLFTYMNRANDIVQLRDSLTTEFISRTDIDDIIRNVLRQMKNNDSDEDDDVNDDGSKRNSFYEGSNESIAGSHKNNNNNQQFNHDDDADNDGIKTTNSLEFRDVLYDDYITSIDDGHDDDDDDDENDDDDVRNGDNVGSQNEQNKHQQQSQPPPLQTERKPSQMLNTMRKPRAANIFNENYVTDAQNNDGADQGDSQKKVSNLMVCFIRLA